MSTKQEKRPGESLEQLLKRFKRRVKSDGTLGELKMRERYEKPTEKRKREFKKAQKRARMTQRQNEL